MTEARDERITYLVANHNQGRYLEECIASLEAQTDPRWLAVICDDGSTDDSLERLRGVTDQRINLLTSRENAGYIQTLERLISEASTDILAVLDADDALEPGATGELLDAWERNPDASLVYSRFARYDATMRTNLGEFGRPIPEGGTAMVQATVGAIRSFRRSAYAKTAGLDPTMLYAEDRDLVYKLEELSVPVFIDKVLYRYRVLPGSHSHDPLKQAIGVRNTRRARRAAIARRNIRGVTRIAAEIAVACDGFDSSHRSPNFLRSLVARVGAEAARVWRRRSRRLARAGAGA
jgi:GT2 family glycosyltransferase